MRDTTISDAATELGGCVERVLNVGYVQRMYFTDEDPPPIVSPDAPKYDITAAGPAKIRDKTTRELKDALNALNLSQLTVGSAATVRENAKNAGLVLQKTVAPSTEGYVGKAKGLKQIAWERGFYSAEDLRAKGLMKVKEEAIRTKLNLCKDFATEISQMQFIAKQLGVEVTMTPKAHPELAGQGIEYSWGYAKLMFRKNNTNGTSKEKAQRLESNVLDAISTENLTIERIRKFVRKARDYKMVYREHFKTLDLMKQSSASALSTEEDANKLKKEIASFEKLHFAKIEKQVKYLKTHRAAADFDTKFIKES